MTVELWAFCGVVTALTLFLSFLFWTTLSTIRAAHQQQVESLRADQKALHSLLKQTQDRIHASSLNDYLTLRAHADGTQITEQPPYESYSRSDAIEAEIAAQRMGAVE